MKKPQILLIVFFLIIISSLFSQTLKKADRIIDENIRSHINYLSDDTLKDHMASTQRDELSDNYIIAQFKKAGCKPMKDSNSWLQKFNIPYGREINDASRLSINGKELGLHSDYFPFAFSASNKAAASVVMELAENGVPWFVDLKELLDNGEAVNATDTSALISARAKRAASKGATALVVYNTSSAKDLVFNSLDPTETAEIPVIYITRPALKKYLSKESSIDFNLNTTVTDRFRNSSNVIGYADNNADSTVMITSHLDDEKDVAALIELSRLLKSKKYRSFNYLFIVYSRENRGADGIKYFHDHPAITLQKVNHTLNLDTIQGDGLSAVKQSMDAINALKTHETKTRP